RSRDLRVLDVILVARDAVVVFRVAFVGQHVAVDLCVFVGRGGVVGRSVPARRPSDLQADGGQTRLGATAIDRLVGEAVAAPEVGAGGVGESAALGIQRQRAVRGAADQRGLDRILVARDAVGVVRVGVVRQHVATDGRV